MWMRLQTPRLGGNVQAVILPCRFCRAPRRSSRHLNTSTLQRLCRSPQVGDCLPFGFHDHRHSHLLSTIRTAAQSSVEDSKDAGVADVRIKRTLADLNAVLGLEDENEPVQGTTPVVTSFNPEALDKIAAAEASRFSKDGKDEAYAKELTNQLSRIMNVVANIDVNSEKTERAGEEELSKEFTRLMEIVKASTEVDKEDIKKLREEVFGPSTFWVTNMQRGGGVIENGWLIQGNLRSDRDKVYDLVSSATHRLFGNKYEVLMLEDPEAEDDENPRIAFQIVAASSLKPEPVGIGQRGLALALLISTIYTCFQLGAICDASHYSGESAAVAQAAATESSSFISFLLSFDYMAFLVGGFPVFAPLLGLQGIHELGHAVVAYTKKVLLAPPLLVPLSQLGTFGAVTGIRSVPRSRKDLFDVAFAGPAPAMLASFALFLLGLWLSTDSPKEDLLVVPAQLFNGSLLMGSLIKLGLGEAMARSGGVLVHPLLVVGWCGLFTNALHCLPVGSLDGGRMMLAAFGPRVLNVTSFLSYLGLVLGFLGSSFSLPFCLFIVLFQREPHRLLLDSVTEVGETRRGLTLALLVFALLVLLPLGFDLPDPAAINAGMLM